MEKIRGSHVIEHKILGWLIIHKEKLLNEKVMLAANDAFVPRLRVFPKQYMKIPESRK